MALPSCVCLFVCFIQFPQQTAINSFSVFVLTIDGQKATCKVRAEFYRICWIKLVIKNVKDINARSSCSVRNVEFYSESKRRDKFQKFGKPKCIIQLSNPFKMD
jgi:hypothetical protein